MRGISFFILFNDMAIKMRKFLFLLAAIFTLGSCVVGAPKKTPVKKQVPVWKPATALVKQLAETSELPFGTIRLPRGYELFDFPFPFEVGTNLSWAKKSATGDISLFLVMQLPREEVGAQNVSLESALSSYLKSYEQMYDNVRRTPAKPGQINGVRALRSEWSGTFRPTGIRLHGTVFITQDAIDTYFIQTAYRNSTPVDKRLAEAAALTFKIQSQN